MMELATRIGFGLMSLALLLNLWRLMRGPTAADRVVALDTMYINTVALLVLLGIWRGSVLYFESGIVIAMLGFIGTIAVCRYLQRGRIVE